MFRIFTLKTKKPPIGWEDITLGQFLEMKKLNTEDENYLFDFACIVFNIDREKFYNMPLDMVNRYMEKIQPMLSQESYPKTKEINSPYITLNGKEYEITGYDKDMTLAQYIDFQASFKTYMENMAEFLSILIVPKGKEYNVGYSKEEVIEDIKAMPIGTALGISRFFFLKWKKLSMDSLTYTQEVLIARGISERKTLTEEEKMDIEKAIVAITLQKRQLKEMEQEFGFK